MAWIRLGYTDISSCVQNNGWTSDFFSLSREVRQGCPLTPYLFIFCAEVLGNSVRNDTRIQGIKVLDTECKISQYADDSTFILDGSQSSFSRSLYLLDTFALISGLKVNYEKIEALQIGSCKSSETLRSPIRTSCTEGRELTYCGNPFFSNYTVHNYGWVCFNIKVGWVISLPASFPPGHCSVCSISKRFYGIFTREV